MTKPSVGDVGPQLRRRYERMMIERLTELLRKEISEQAVTEAEVAEHVEKHRSTLEPEVLVRVSQIMLGSKKEAEELLTEIFGASDRVGWLTRVLSSMWRIDHSSCARRAASCGQRRKRDRAQSVLVSVELDTRSRRELPDVPD